MFSSSRGEIIISPGLKYMRKTPIELNLRIWYSVPMSEYKELLTQLLACRDRYGYLSIPEGSKFKHLSSGTTRHVYTHEDHPDVVFKVDKYNDYIECYREFRTWLKATPQERFLMAPVLYFDPLGALVMQRVKGHHGHTEAQHDLIRKNFPWSYDLCDHNILTERQIRVPFLNPRVYFIDYSR